jgi:hypothetical protein
VFTDESVRSACAYTLQAIGQHNQDILKEHSSVVIPLVFFAMHASKIPGKIILFTLILTALLSFECQILPCNYSVEMPKLLMG